MRLYIWVDCEHRASQARQIWFSGRGKSLHTMGGALGRGEIGMSGKFVNGAWVESFMPKYQYIGDPARIIPCDCRGATGDPDGDCVDEACPGCIDSADSCPFHADGSLVPAFKNLFEAIPERVSRQE